MAVLRDAPTILLIGIFKIKTFLWMHGTNPASAFATRLSALLSNFVFSRADLIGLMSNDEINYFRAMYPRRKDSFTLVRPGVNLARLRKIAKKRSAKKLNLLFISRLIADKGPAETVEAYLSSKDKIPPSQLFIAGAGPMENDLRKKTKNSAVKFLGHVRDDNSLYKNSDMLILPTYHNEGMPVTIVKALVFGLPIITTKTRGIKDWLVSGENCLFTKAKDIVNLQEKIIVLANNKPLRQKMSRNNSRLARVFSQKKAADNLKLIYKKCLR
jgi:glycosyltransferase involved in cell wall biosynthesis